VRRGYGYLAHQPGAFGGAQGGPRAQIECPPGSGNPSVDVTGLAGRDGSDLFLGARRDDVNPLVTNRLQPLTADKNFVE
jgi:hypothetical protein